MGDALEELRAMNAAPSGGRGPVRNQDKRTSRLDNKDSFQRAILQHRAGLPAIGWEDGKQSLIPVFNQATRNNTVAALHHLQCRTRLHHEDAVASSC